MDAEQSRAGEVSAGDSPGREAVTADARVSAELLATWRDRALAYLREQLGSDAPHTLGDPTVFTWSPLEGEGAAAVFAFSATRGTNQPTAYYVVAGETESNYYAAEDLTPEEAWELHLGTRFMLVLGVAQMPISGAPEDPPYDMQGDAELIVRRVSDTASIDNVHLAAMFDVDGHKHAVLRARLSGKPVYIMARDAPHGFSTKTHLSPHFAYRLHIGHVLRREAKPDAS